MLSLKVKSSESLFENTESKGELKLDLLSQKLRQVKQVAKGGG